MPDEMLREMLLDVRREMFEEMALYPGGAGSGRKTRPLHIPMDLFPVGGYGPGKSKDYSFVGFDDIRFLHTFGSLPNCTPLEDKRLFKTIPQG